MTASTAEDELHGALKIVFAWREEELKPSEIAVLYRADTEGWVKRLASLISQQHARGGIARNRRVGLGYQQHPRR